ncbi:MAG: flagellar hook-associated protein FlgK [Deltaproteobacteria bacterium]|nr:MAG: flagellar hook-associated protein FlgK [Deltaproteobacteria bacterium]
MGGVLDILNISVGTLLNQQVALEVTSHNIANISTPNYARQRVIQKTRFPLYAHYGARGRGARIANIEQVRDQFVDRFLLEKNSTYNYYVGKDDIMTKIESLLNETEDYGLSHDLQEFWNSWQALARNPQGSAERQSIVEKATALADKIRNIYAGFEEYKDGIEQKIESGISKINTILEKIADLNKEIARREVTGHPANDLRDERQQALEELREYVDFDYREEDNGWLTVQFYTNHSTGAKVTMVSGGNYGKLTVPASGVSPVFSGTDAAGNAVASFDFDGGKFSGWKDMWDEISNGVDGYEDKLNTLANTIIQQVNSYQDYNDGVNIHHFFNGSDASNIEFNDEFETNLSWIMAGSSPGDNSTAITMANLGEVSQVALGGESINGYWQNFITSIGTEAQQVEAKKDFQEALKNELRSEQQAVSGVSMEEEMTNMIQYQHIYQAAARMITTGKEMLDTLINMT